MDDRHEIERFAGSPDCRPATHIRCSLENDRRRFHVLGENGIEPLNGTLTLDIMGGAATEGQLRHWPGQADTQDQSEREAIIATLMIPSDRMAWLAEKLTAFNAVFTLGIKVELFKEEIALAFDEVWMSQDFVLKRDEKMQITGYDLCVTQRSKEMSDGIKATPDNQSEVVSNLPRQIHITPARIQDKRLDYILFAILALVVITLLKEWG